SASEPLTVDLEDPRSPLARLPEKDRYWLVDSGFRLVAPILARDGSLLGLIGLGRRRAVCPSSRRTGSSCAPSAAAPPGCWSWSRTAPPAPRTGAGRTRWTARPPSPSR